MTFHLDNPKALYLLFLLIPAALISIFQYVKLKKSISSFNNISKHHIVRRLIFRIICYCAAFFCIVFALSDPYWGIQPIATQTNGTAVSYVFDISYSMNAVDAGVKHNTKRLEAVKLYAKALTKELYGSAVSVVLAKGDGFVAIPLTEDLYSVENLLENLSPGLISNPGTNLAKGITTAIESFPTQSARQSSIVLFTDGDETEGKLEQAITEATTYGIKVVIIGFGSEQGAEVISGDGITPVYTTLKSKELKALVADITNKSNRNINNSVYYFDATEFGSMKKILNIIEPEKSSKDFGIAYEMKPVPRYNLFIILAFIFVIIGVLFAELNIKRKKRGLNALLIFSLVIMISSCSSDFANGQRILYSTLQWYQKDYQEATVGFMKVTEEAKLTQNQELLQYGLFGLASSYMMQEEETAALEKLEEIAADAPESLRFATYYNIGIIAHKHGEYEKAKEAFKQALLIDNTNIDAKINYELSFMENASNSSAGEKELKPISESDYQSSREDTIFSIIRENEQNRWKNSESQNQQRDILDY